MLKYEVILHRNGVASPQKCANLSEIQSFISYLMSSKSAGESINITIIKNYDKKGEK